MISTEVLPTHAWRVQLVNLPAEKSQSNIRSLQRLAHTAPLGLALLNQGFKRTDVGSKGAGRHTYVRLISSKSKSSEKWQTRVNEHGFIARSLAAAAVDANHKLTPGVDGEIIDVVTLGNLCVDIVKHVEELPPTDTPRRRAYMDAMVAHPPPETQWEGGGNCNTAIAAARLGLKCTALGHIGDEVFGDFLRRVLASEGVGFQEVQETESVPLGGGDYDGETLLCWVIIHPTDGHTFCSRFDFNKGPAFSQLTKLPPAFGKLMSRSRAVFCNGFVYDELPPPTVHAALRKAREHGAAVFFDPGPRGEAFCKASEYKRECVETLMKLSDVVLMTAEEAETITGLRDQEAAAEALLNRGGAIQWVVIKDGGRGCHMTTHEGSFWLPAYRIDVADTVGCGDSFAAAVVLGFIRGEGPITTLALANAVGAATAMGVGAGRNVAQSDVLASILSDEARQQGVVTVRLKSRSKSSGREASSSRDGDVRVCGDQSGVALSRDSRARDSRKLLSNTESFSKDARGVGAVGTGGSIVETSGNGRSSQVQMLDEGYVSDVQNSPHSLTSNNANGSGIKCRRVSPLEEIKRLQLMSNGHVATVDGEGQAFKVQFQAAAKAAVTLLERSKQEQTLPAVVN